MAVDSFSAFINTDGSAFPNNGAVNSTGAGLFDGTEVVALLVNNYCFGPQQALLDFANITPSGSAEAAGASQELEAIMKGFNVGAGIRQMSDLNSTETAKRRMLPLNGQGVLRASYADLDTATYVGDGTNAAAAAAGGGYYRADDAAGTAPNIIGIYLILPESRGYTPRGLDTAAAVDPGGASRVLGDNQDFALENITGDFDIKRVSNDSPSIPASSSPFTRSIGTGISGSTVTHSATIINADVIGFNANLVVQTSTETRGTNISTNFVVGY